MIGKSCITLKYYHFYYSRVSTYVCISWFILFFVAKFLCFPVVIHLRVALKTITHFTISHLCFYMIYFYCKRFCQKIFIMCYRMSLWFGIIKCSLCIYRPQIPVDHKDRLYNENSIVKGRKSEPSFKRKPQLYETLTYCSSTTNIKVLS